MQAQFRILTIVLGAILLLFALPLFSRASPDSVLLDRYSLKYAIFLFTYCLVLVALLVPAIITPPPLVRRVFLPLKWLHRFPIVLAVLAYALLEGWYAIRGLVIARSYFGEPDSIATRLVLWAAGLLAFYLTCVLIFAGREPEDLRETAINVSLILAGSLLAFVVFSFAYVLTIQRDEYLRAHTIGQTIVFNPVIGAMPAPNVDGAYYFPETGQMVPLTTNSEGFRGAEPSENPRVAVIGDSFMFGEFVSDDDLWLPEMEELIDQPVANYSIYGIDFRRYHTLADVYIDPGEHDLVIYAVYANDLNIFYEPGEPLVVKRSSARRSIWLSSNPMSFTFGDFFLQHSPLSQIRLMMKAAQAKRNAPPPPDLPHGLAPVCNGLASAWRDEAQLALQTDLDIAITAAQSDGYRLLFVLIPSKTSVYRDVLLQVCDQSAVRAVEKEEDGYQFICDYLAARAVPCYDMTRDITLAAQTSEGPLYFPVDGHFNPDGHAVFARLLADYLRAHDLLPEGDR